MDKQVDNTSDCPIELTKVFKTKTQLSKKTKNKHMVTLFSNIDLDFIKFLCALLLQLERIAVENPSDIAKKQNYFK